MKPRLASLLPALLAAAAVSAPADQGPVPGSLFARVDDPSAKATRTYAEIYEGFYGLGTGKPLLQAALDVRPDGVPNVTLDREARKAQFLIRLSVDESAYDEWRKKAHELVENSGMNVRVSDEEDALARRIGGRPYRFGEIEDAALRRWEADENTAKRSELTVRCELVDPEGRALRSVDVPVKNFHRDGFDSFPLPLYRLNRLLDLPKERFAWGEKEDAFASFVLTGLSDDDLNRVVDVRCTVLDAETLSRERRDAARAARERRETKLKSAVSAIIDELVPIPGTGLRMGRFEVSQVQWQSVMGDNPARFIGAENPVENVSWNDCQAFLRKLNAHPTVKQAGLTFRLPTDEEWELACRAGASGDYCRLADGTEVSAATLGMVAWYGNNSEAKTHPVGQKTPNAFGLHDMLGNVSEWTQTAVGEFRVDCGGCWFGNAGNCGAASRGGNSASFRNYYLGFRLCATATDN